MMPKTAEEAKTHMHETKMAGFPGCVSSTDATHITMDCCSYKYWQLHVGFKLKFPSRACNVSINHRRQTLFSTDEHPASWNNKTLQTFDIMMGDIRSGKLLTRVKFTLRDRNATEELIKVQYVGAWQLIDNRYLTWSTDIFPMKMPVTIDDDRFSRWTESMQRDVECAFDILNRQFLILRFPIPIHSTDAIDQIWKTCCAL